MAFERTTAIKCSVKELLDGSFIKQEGWQSSYIQTSQGKIYRINLVATVVGKDTETAIRVDDGTGTINLRSFSGPLECNIGDIVSIICWPRLFEDQLYLVPEILKPTTKDWFQLRKKELQLLYGQIEENQHPNIEKENQKTPPKEITTKEIKKEEVKEDPAQKEDALLEEEVIENYGDKLITLIKELDDGKGADIESVIEKAQMKNVEKLLENMLLEGEIFELRPGKVKVLE